MISRLSRTMTAVFTAASVLVIPAAVHAQTKTEGTDVVDEEQYNNEDELGRKRPKHEPLYLGLDVTVGFGNYAVAMGPIIKPPSIDPSWQLDVTQIRTVNFTVMGHYRFRKFGIGMRLPLISGHIAGDPAIQAGAHDIFI